MRIARRKKKGVAIFDLEGNIDINSSDFIEAVGWALTHGRKEIICNMSGVNLIDYIGVSVLAIIYKNVINHNAKIKFYGVPYHVKKLFSIVGLNRVFECYDTEEAALQSFKEEKVIDKILKKKLRRRFTRVPFKSTIEYRGKFSREDSFYKGKIINLSGIGAFVIGEKVFSVDEILSTRLYLLPKPGIVEVEAKVIWVSSDGIHPIEYPAMGIEFYNITSRKQKVIIDFVEKHIASKGF